MWLAPKEKRGSTPEQFNEHYMNNKSKGDHYQDILSLTGNLVGKTVLDLGGGTLLSETYFWYEEQYTLVDFSIEACHQSEDTFKRRHRGLGNDAVPDIHCVDVIEWLKKNERKFNLCLCFGLMEYLPPTALADLCALCPSDVLCLGVSAAEAYLQYPGRITIYSAEDIEQITTDAGWKEVKRLPMHSHVWARYERVK